MGSRIKILGTFAIVGFLGGIVANVFFRTLWPWLLTIFPSILTAEWVISGIAGALITTCIIIIWVYLSSTS